MLTDAEVLARSRRHPHLFAEIIDRHHDAIHAYVSRRAGHQVADDVGTAARTGDRLGHAA